MPWGREGTGGGPGPPPPLPWRRPPPPRWVPGLGEAGGRGRQRRVGPVGPRRSRFLSVPPQAEAPVPAETVRRWLRAEGADPAAPAEEQLGLAWRLLRRAEARLGDLERRRAEEMRDVRAGRRRQSYPSVFNPSGPKHSRFPLFFCSSRFTGVPSQKLLSLALRNSRLCSPVPRVGVPTST